MNIEWRWLYYARALPFHDKDRYHTPKDSFSIRRRHSDRAGHKVGVTIPERSFQSIGAIRITLTVIVFLNQIQ